MAKITTLPKALEAELPAIRDHWVNVGLSHQPISRDRIRTLLDGCFGVIGKKGPRFLITLRSPQEVAFAVALLRTSSGAQVSAQVSDQVRAQVSDQVLDQVRAQVSDQVSDQVRDQVSDQVRAQVSDQVSDQVRAQVRDQVSDQVRAQVLDQVRAQVSELMSWRWWYGFGQFESFWVAYYRVMERLGVDCSKLHPMMQLCEEAGWSVLFWDWAFVSERPCRPISRDQQNRLHCEDGPAVLYSDGFGVWAIHGVRVRRYIVEEPHRITVAEIETEQNAEVRRVMIERYGQSRYLVDSGAVEIHHDDFGTLYRKEIPGDEPLVMVKVVNSTAEPDGSFKDYFIRVPPSMERAHQAVAWTFGKTEADYAPLVET